MKKNIPWAILIKKLKCEILPEEQQELDRWLGDDECQDIYWQIQAVWNNLLQEGMSYESNIDNMWKKIECRIRESEPRVVQFSLSRLRRFAAVASVLLLMLLSFTIYTTNQWQKAGTMEQTYSAMGGKSKVILPDGSKVWLNTESDIKYTSSAWGKERKVELNGEALFEVVKDTDRPFIVQTGKFEVVVHGTTFNVDAKEEYEEMSVSLINGAVSVKSGNEVKSISPGEEAICTKNTGAIKVNKADVGFAALWAQESLRFEKKSIKELSRYLSKWYGVKIIIDPAIPNDQAYTFSVKNEPLEEILRLMARLNPVKYSFDEDNVVRISLN